MKNKVGYKESALGTGFIILVVYLISLIPLNSDIINPISKTFEDFSLTDIYYSHIKSNPPLNDNIVLVNIGDLPRAGIAELVEIINEDQPKVIGIDAFFRKPLDPEGDSLLASAFSKVENLVLVSQLYVNKETKKVDSVGYSHSRFSQFTSYGFANFFEDSLKLHVIRYYIPQEEFNGKHQRSFAAELVHCYDPVLADKFLARNNELEEINYQGNLFFGQNATSNSKNVFFALDVFQVLDRQFEPGMFKDKIVVMGYMGSHFEDGSIVDKFYTPLNPNYIGKAHEDMFGVVIHANVVGMMLKENYINTIPVVIDYLIWVIFIFFNVWLFAWMFYNLEAWFDGASILVTLIEVVILMGIQIFMFAVYDYKLDITLPVVALLLMGNMVEFYFGMIHPAGVKILSRNSIFVKTKPI